MGTHYHHHDARLEGFVARMVVGDATSEQLVGHIARGTTNSPFISLTRSYGVARGYAMACRKIHMVNKRGFVYVLEIDKKSAIELLDPVKKVSRLLGDPYAEPSYHHDGAQGFILGVADPIRHWEEKDRRIDQPPASDGTSRPANLHRHFETLIRSLRDAEILAVRAIPGKYIVDRLDVN